MKFEGDRHDVEQLDTSQVNCDTYIVWPAQLKHHMWQVLKCWTSMQRLRAHEEGLRGAGYAWRYPNPEGHPMFRESSTPFYSSAQSLCAGAFTWEPGDVWSSADHEVYHLLHCSGPGRLNSTMKEHQICSCYITSDGNNRMIICLYFKAKGKHLKRGFVQLSGTSVFALRYAKG